MTLNQTHGAAAPIPLVMHRARRLTASIHPGVALRRLAELCVPTFSDACLVVVEERGGAGYHLELPGPTQWSFDPSTWLQHGPRQEIDGRTVVTSVRLEPVPGFAAFDALVAHRWDHSTRPSPSDAALCTVLLEHAVAAVRHERVLHHAGSDHRTDPTVRVAAGTLMLGRLISYDRAVRQLEAAARREGRAVSDVAIEVLTLASIEQEHLSVGDVD